MNFREKLLDITISLIKIISRILPLKNQIIFESIPNLSDNTFFLYKKMIEKGYNKKYKMIWFLNTPYNGEPLPKNVYTKNYPTYHFTEKIDYCRTICRSKFIIDCNHYIHKENPKQKRIHLKHGLPFKDASFYNYEIGEIDLLSVPSEYWVPVCAEEHQVDISLVKPLGFPRNDVLIPKSHEAVNIIWMPTYISSASVKSDGRLNLIKKMPFGIPCIDNIEQLEKVNELFRKNNATLYIRFHPAQDTSLVSATQMSNIVLCDDSFLKNNNTTLYGFLCNTDALISDYSSIYYDYLNLDKPIALVTKFFNEYKNECNSLKYSYEEFTEKFPAVFVNSYDELLVFFNKIFNGEDPDAKNRKTVREKYMPEKNIDSSENIINYMKKHFKF